MAPVDEIPEENRVKPADPQPGQPRFLPPGETGKGVRMSAEEFAALPEVHEPLVVQIPGDPAITE